MAPLRLVAFAWTAGCLQPGFATYDAVHLFARALHDLDHSQEINTRPLSCDGSDTWQHGNSLVNYMKLVRAILFVLSKASISGDRF